jgi:hypothetical protein
MRAKIATVTVALMANGLCLLWPSRIAPTISTGPARCVMAISHNACTASTPCACAISDENRTVFVLEADLPLVDSADPRPFCRKGEKAYGPAGPADPAHPYETCKPRGPRGSQRR